MRGLVPAVDDRVLARTGRKSFPKASDVGAELVVAPLVTRVRKDEVVLGRRRPDFVCAAARRPQERADRRGRDRLPLRRFRQLPPFYDHIRRWRRRLVEIVRSEHRTVRELVPERVADARDERARMPPDRLTRGGGQIARRRDAGEVAEDAVAARRKEPVDADAVGAVRLAAEELSLNDLREPA